MNKIRISKRHRPVSWRSEPLPTDPCDRDIVRAKQLAGRSRPPGGVGEMLERVGVDAGRGHRRGAAV